MRDLSSLPVEPVGPTDHVRGDDTQPLIIYAEFSCPDCAIAAERLRASNASVCFRHFALAARSPRAVKLAIASEAAARQGLFGSFTIHSSPTRAGSMTLTSGSVASCSASMLTASRSIAATHC